MTTPGQAWLRPGGQPTPCARRRRLRSGELGLRLLQRGFYTRLQVEQLRLPAPVCSDLGRSRRRGRRLSLAGSGEEGSGEEALAAQSRALQLDLLSPHRLRRVLLREHLSSANGGG